MTRIFDPKRKSAKATANAQGSDQAAFSSAGVASVTSAGQFLAQFGGASVLGEPGLDEVEATAGNAAHKITVPTGKYWRLVGLFHSLVTDANAADRILVISLADSADTEIEEISHAIVTASTTAKRVTLFGTDDFVRGDRAVAATGKLTIAEPVTDTDQFSINGVQFTLLAALTGAANEILIGADEAATKINIAAALGGTAATNVHSVTDAVRVTLEMSGTAAFDGDDLVFTAAVKGAAGNALTIAESGNELTHGSNVFDAATLGNIVAGLDAADKVSTLDHPTAGPYLGPGEDIDISVTDGVAGDAYDTYLFYVEFDADVS